MLDEPGFRSAFLFCIDATIAGDPEIPWWLEVAGESSIFRPI